MAVFTAGIDLIAVVDGTPGEPGADAENLHFSVEGYGGTASTGPSVKVTNTGVTAYMGTKTDGIHIVSMYANGSNVTVNRSFATTDTSAIVTLLNNIYSSASYNNSLLCLTSYGSITIDDALASILEKWGGNIPFRVSSSEAAFVFAGKKDSLPGSAVCQFVPSDGATAHIEFDFINFEICNAVGGSVPSTGNLVRNANLLNREEIGNREISWAMSGSVFDDAFIDREGGCVKGDGTWPTVSSAGVSYANLLTQNLKGRLDPGRWYTISFDAVSSPLYAGQALRVIVGTGVADLTAGYWTGCNGVASGLKTTGSTASGDVAATIKGLPSYSDMGKSRYFVTFKTSSSLLPSTDVYLIFRNESPNRVVVGRIQVEGGTKATEFSLALADSVSATTRQRKESEITAGSWVYSGREGEPYRDLVWKGDSLQSVFVVRKLHTFKSVTIGAGEYYDNSTYLPVVATDILLSKEVYTDLLVTRRIHANNDTFVIDEDGNVTCNGGTFNNVTIKGSLSQPWILIEADYDNECFVDKNGDGPVSGWKYDHLLLDSTRNNGGVGGETGIWLHDWLDGDNDDIGRTVTVANIPNNDDFYSATTYPLTLHNSQDEQHVGKYFFYEDGYKYAKLTVHDEIILMRGIGNGVKFMGWFVTERIKLKSRMNYGKVKRIMGCFVTSAYDTTASYDLETGEQITGKYDSTTGVFTFTYSENPTAPCLYALQEQYIVFVQPIHASSVFSATLTSQAVGQFTVKVSPVPTGIPRINVLIINKSYT